MKVRQAYEAELAEKGFKSDPAQLRAVDALQRCADEWADYKERRSNALKKLIHRPPVPRGVYMYGGVGRGKSFLMDCFFNAVPIRRKVRLHFHEFMREAHERINAHRAAVKEGRAKGDDPIPPVAEAIAAQARILCFDEFTVTDIADAMILSRLFDALFARGVVLVATSNVAPDDLYRDGLNRPLFLPFVETLKRHADIFFLDAPTDYRMETVEGEHLYVTPLGPEAERRMDALWRSILSGVAEGAETVEVAGRRVAVPRAGNGAARFRFADLLQRPLGANDYLALAARYDTLVLDDIPALTQDQRNEAKRFILLVDTLYDAGRRIVVSAAAPAHELYRARSGTELFEFDRTVSRLTEMRSADYLERAAKTREGRTQAAEA